MPNAEEARRQEVILRRLVAMGLDARPLPGGRSVVAILPLGPAPFESVWGDQRFEAVRFATVGVDRAKCLSPRPLFALERRRSRTPLPAGAPRGPAAPGRADHRVWHGGAGDPGTAGR